MGAPLSRLAVFALVVALLGLGLWATNADRFGDAARTDGERSATVEPDSADAPDTVEESADRFAPVDVLATAPQQQFDAPRDVLDPNLDYRAVIETNVGTLTLDLYESRAPRTVNNFVFLALHRYYEGVPFHRVIEDFMAQTGDPTGTGRGGPGYAFDDEIAPNLSHDRPGLLSMANAGPDTNGSQFFITMAATPWLDGAHAIFGEVVDGIETLDALTRVDPQNPSVIADLSDPAATLVEQGVREAEGFRGDVEAFLRAELDELPSQGQTFRVAGRRGVFGSAGGVPAVGLFPVPDRIERVTVLARAKEEQP